MVLFVHGFTLVVGNSLRFQELQSSACCLGMCSSGFLALLISVSSSADSDSSGNFRLFLSDQLSAQSGGFLSSSFSSELLGSSVLSMEDLNDLVLFDDTSFFVSVGLQNGSLGSL